MTEANFNKRQCIRALRKLGFYENSKRGRLVTVRKIVDIYRRQKNKNSPLAFVLPWF